MKVNVYRNKKALSAANGRSCVCCGAMDGTVVRAHYTGLRQHQYGKGKGIKGHDHIAADLCQKCHSHFDEYKIGAKTYEQKIESSEQFLHYCVLTIARDLHEGIYETGCKS